MKQLSYSRDNIGNITAITDTLNPSNTKSYSYDNLHRLTLSTGSWGAITYAYDNVGNRTYETTDTGNTTYNYTLNTNKLTLTTGEKNLTFTYDNNGNTTAENTRQFIYNQNQRLTRVTDTGTVLGEYIYNGNGQRADKLIPSQNKCTVFHYDQNGSLITESTRTGNIKAEYVYLNEQPLAKIEGNNVYYYHNDHLGTPMMMTDSSGSLVWQGEFLPFGESLSVTGSITNNLRFSGQYYDSETGLHQNGFRDYKPEIGRYPQADPIGIEGGINLYIYTQNNPINLIDPMGLKKKYCCDAQLPSSTTKEIALTCFAEASNNCGDGDKEKRAITDCVYNRAKKNKKYWCGSNPLDVVKCPNQFLGYGSSQYKKAENPKNLNEKECEKLKSCISAVQASSSGTQDSYTNFNQTNKPGRTSICSHYFWVE